MSERKEFIKNIDSEMYRRRKKRNFWLKLDYLLAGSIAALGLLAAGAAENFDFVIQGKNFDFIFGVLVAILAALKQVREPKVKTEEHEGINRALNAIKNAVKYRDLPLSRAAKMYTTVTSRNDPEGVLNELSMYEPEDE